MGELHCVCLQKVNNTFYFISGTDDSSNFTFWKLWAYNHEAERLFHAVWHEPVHDLYVRGLFEREEMRLRVDFYLDEMSMKMFM